MSLQSIRKRNCHQQNKKTQTNSTEYNTYTECHICCESPAFIHWCVLIHGSLQSLCEEQSVSPPLGLENENATCIEHEEYITEIRINNTNEQEQILIATYQNENAEILWQAMALIMALIITWQYVMYASGITCKYTGFVYKLALHACAVVLLFWDHTWEL